MSATPGGGRLAGLDGLRAVAVAAVLAYHADPALLPGGFLGVDLFFVLSGFLITGILLEQVERDGTIDLAGFWQRRARRLVPALVVLCAAVLALAVVALPDEVGRVRREVLGGLAWLTNWQLLAGGDSYFEAAARPPLLRHLWSLGVEAQFYLTWPLVLAAVLRFARPVIVIAVAVAGALASAGWMTVLHDPAVDPSRVYFGTDTRLSPLLLGAALAALVAVRPSIVAEPARAAVRLGRRLVGVAALAAVLAFFAAADPYDPVLYRGGLLAFAVAAAVLVLATLADRPLGWLLDLGPLRWVGERSYGIYLWHWPIYMVTRPGVDVTLDPLTATVLRLSLTVLLAALSYRLVELPIRRGGWWPSPTGFARRRLRPSLSTALVGAASTAVVAVLVTTSFVPTAGAGERPSYLPVDRISGRLGVDEPAAYRPGPPLRAAPGASSAPAARSTERPRTPRQPSILALGDSVMISAAEELGRRFPGIEVDAEIGRFFPSAIELLSARRAAGTLPDVVVIHLGNNGPFFHRQFDDLMTSLGDVRLVVFVNLRVPRDWEAVGNDVLARGTARYRNAVLVDWHGAAAGRRELFWKDGYHVRVEGGLLYADLVGQALATAGIVGARTGAVARP